MYDNDNDNDNEPVLMNSEYTPYVQISIVAIFYEA